MNYTPYNTYISIPFIRQCKIHCMKLKLYFYISQLLYRSIYVKLYLYISTPIIHHIIYFHINHISQKSPLYIYDKLKKSTLNITVPPGNLKKLRYIQMKSVII